MKGFLIIVLIIIIIAGIVGVIWDKKAQVYPLKDVDIDIKKDEYNDKKANDDNQNVYYD